ncbi:unnamed protein product [Notodromas monacha]|uniref:SAP domain-containing protein n=1 Tax=Notodromas monacha TaxID=399045 RepID=A0A7R9BEY1_9CRUS|nr:unnamed protein product [Notodromas monacha]CAG0913573.1 unnamed protein product [Notodromas monacha]
MGNKSKHHNHRRSILNARNYDDLSKEDLREILKHRGLQTTGKKEVLVKRLQKSDRDLQQKQTEGIPASLMPQRVDGQDGSLKSVNGMSGAVPNGYSRCSSADLRKERAGIVLWKRPLTTLQYFSLELSYQLGNLAYKLNQHRAKVTLLMLFLALSVIGYYAEGPHQKLVVPAEKILLWCLYWVGLGVLSSIGLGTGLHTFLLYLGPHVAAVTLAAYECNSLNFPEPPYPDELLCPDGSSRKTGWSNVPINIWTIMSKVRLEAFMWGAGTALGELPPYFMARAARLSGTHPDDDEFKEFEELQELQRHPENLSMVDRLKLSIEKLVEKVGFFGILVCASIPNPLFDLAGITCGHFLVPFWTFFGATLIGKAVIKMHIQKLFVIIAFNENHVESAVAMLQYVPIVGKKVQEPFKEFLQKQKLKLHRSSSAKTGPVPESWLQWFFEKLVVAMVAYFLLSIVNAWAQNYHKRLTAEKRPLSKAEKQK